MSSGIKVLIPAGITPTGVGIGQRYDSLSLICPKCKKDRIIYLKADTPELICQSGTCRETFKKGFPGISAENLSHGGKWSQFFDLGRRDEVSRWVERWTGLTNVKVEMN